MNVVYVDDDDSRRKNVPGITSYATLREAESAHASFAEVLVFLHASNDDVQGETLGTFCSRVLAEKGRVILFSGGTPEIIDAASSKLRGGGYVEGRDFMVLTKCDIVTAVPWRQLALQSWDLASPLREWLFGGATTVRISLYILCLAFLSIHAVEATQILGERADALLGGEGMLGADGRALQWRSDLQNGSWWGKVVQATASETDPRAISSLLTAINANQPLSVQIVAEAFTSLEVLLHR